MNPVHCKRWQWVAIVTTDYGSLQFAAKQFYGSTMCVSHVCQHQLLWSQVDLLTLVGIDLGGTSGQWQRLAA